MKTLLAVLLFACVSAAHACFPVTIGASFSAASGRTDLPPQAAGQPGGGALPGVVGGNPLSADNFYTFPVIVAPGTYLGINSIHFYSDHAANAAFAINGVITVTSTFEHVTFPSQPLRVSPGFVLTATVINAASVSQNVSAIVLGWVSTDPLFKDCK